MELLPKKTPLHVIIIIIIIDEWDTLLERKCKRLFLFRFGLSVHVEETTENKVIKKNA